MSNFDQILPRNHVLASRSDLACLILPKIGTNKRLHHTNKHVKEFFYISQNLTPHGQRSNVKFKFFRLNNYSCDGILLWELQNDGSFSFLVSLPNGIKV